MKKLGLFLAACWIGISSCAAQSRTEYVAPENTQFRVVGYVPGYRDLDAIPDRTLAQLDIACYAFATIDSTGIPRVANEKQLARFVRRAHRLGVKVMLSFNGKHTRFAQMASDDRQRKAFVDEIWRLVQKYRMDGVDNDWEFPRTTDGTAESNLALMKDLARLCRGGEKQYLLTMAVTSGLYPGNRSDAISDELIALVDWLNVMVYGNFSETRPYQQHSTYSMLEKSYDYWIVRRGMDPRKFIAGLPVYGLASGLPKRTSSASYATILRQNGPQAMVCDSALVVNSVHTTPYWVYYNGLPTIYRKVAFSVDKGLGGIMFWEVSQDTTEGASLVKAACDAARFEWKNKEE